MAQYPIPTNPGGPGFTRRPSVAPPAPTPPPPYPTNQQVQGTLSTGSNSLLIAPVGYTCLINLRFNNPIAYDITLNVTRAHNTSIPSTLQCYSLTLDPGDTVQDGGYILYPGDEISVNTLTAGTNYFLTITYNYYFNRT